MPGFRYADFVEQVERRAAFEPGGVDRVIDATLRALASQLPAMDIELIAEQLPGPMGATWRSAQPSRATGARALYAAVQRAVGGDTARVTEYVQVIAQVLGERLDLDGRLHLQRHLPESAAELVEPRSWRPAGPKGHAPESADPGEGHTLASGKPGSAHPLSGTEASRAHRDSLARTDNPHATTKLSTGHPSVDDPGTTVATGHPAHRTISDAHDYPQRATMSTSLA